MIQLEKHFQILRHSNIALTALSTLITIGVKIEGPTAITKSRIDKINKQYNTDIELKANENSLAEVVLNNKKEEKNTNESTRVEKKTKKKMLIYLTQLMKYNNKLKK